MLSACACKVGQWNTATFWVAGSLLMFRHACTGPPLPSNYGGAPENAEQIWQVPPRSNGQDTRKSAIRRLIPKRHRRADAVVRSCQKGLMLFGVVRDHGIRLLIGPFKPLSATGQEP